MEFLWLGIALAVGFGAGWVLSRQRATAELARYEGRLEELQGQLVRAQRANEALLAKAGGGQSEPDDSGDGADEDQTERPFAHEVYDGFDGQAGGALDGDDKHRDGAEDLTRIRGIGTVLQDKLYDLGITSYQQVADLTAEERARLDKTLQLRGRIDRDDWVGQAKRLAAD